MKEIIVGIMHFFFGALRSSDNTIVSLENASGIPIYLLVSQEFVTIWNIVMLRSKTNIQA
jgi:hypothetical protein